MTRQSRRTFLTSASLLSLAAAAKAVPMQKEKSLLIHIAFFYLKNPKSTADRDKLVEGIKSLERIETIRSMHVGIPADTPARSMKESGYNVSELLFFDDVAGQTAYQDHSIHKDFVDNYSTPLCKKVVVYDSVTV